MSAWGDVSPAGPVRRPVAWRIHPGDVAWFAAHGEHCETRRCGREVAVVTWRYYRHQGQVLVAERLVCEEHGRAFAERHHVAIGPAPDEPTRRRDAPGAGGDAG